MSSELEDLEAYADYEHREHSAYYRNARDRNRMKNVNERHRMKAAAAKRDQEIFDRVGLPKGTP